MNRMVAALLGVCVVAAVVLAVTDRVTRERILEAQRQEVVRSLDAVLPPHTNQPDRDTRQVTPEGGSPVTLYLARQRDQWVGTALQVTAPDGYSGDIQVMVGVDRQGVLTGVFILAHAETPGLGDRIVGDRDWLPGFRGRSLENTHWAVKKDGGDIDQFTGATITPRAVVGAVKRALEVCRDFCR